MTKTEVEVVVTNTVTTKTVTATSKTATATTNIVASDEKDGNNKDITVTKRLIIRNNYLLANAATHLSQ